VRVTSLVSAMLSTTRTNRAHVPHFPMRSGRTSLYDTPMRARILIGFAVILLGCKKSPPPPPEPKAAAICDNPVTHACTEVYDSLLVPETERWCLGLAADFSKGAVCKQQGRTGACLEPSGSVEWSYGSMAKAQISCHALHGRFIADDVPDAGPSARYSCMIPHSPLTPLEGTCLEQDSVVDLAATEDKINCAKIGGTFAVGPCPPDARVGRCGTPQHSTRATRIFYATKYDAGTAHGACDQLQGKFE